MERTGPAHLILSCPNEPAPRYRFVLAELRGRLTSFHEPLASTGFLLQNLLKIRNLGTKRDRYRFDLYRQDEAANRSYGTRTGLAH